MPVVFRRLGTLLFLNITSIILAASCQAPKGKIMFIMFKKSSIVGVFVRSCCALPVRSASYTPYVRNTIVSTPSPFLPFGAASRSGKPRVEPCLSACRQLSRSGKPRVKPYSIGGSMTRYPPNPPCLPKVKPYFIGGASELPPNPHPPPSRPPRGGRHPVQFLCILFSRAVGTRGVACCVAFC